MSKVKVRAVIVSNKTNKDLQVPEICDRVNQRKNVKVSVRQHMKIEYWCLHYTIISVAFALEQYRIMWRFKKT